jgi:hypothetical protein
LTDAQLKEVFGGSAGAALIFNVELLAIVGG